VLIADDHEPFRAGLRGGLPLADGIELAGEASDGPGAVTQAQRLQLDVVLMDLKMPALPASRRPGGSPAPAHTSAWSC
jgi:DNA-binding NarL/FixJ family response regulator